MTRNIEGTIVLEGLLEGRLPHGDFETELRRWMTLARQAGLRFQLDIDGNLFSLLPDNTPMDVNQLAPDPAKLIADTVERLIRRFYDHDVSLPFSTLRSTETRRGEQVLTLYNIEGDRSVSFYHRTVEAKTTEPQKPLSGKDRVKLAAAGLAMAAIVVAATSLFVDYGTMWHKLRNAVMPLHPEKMRVDASAFEKFVKVDALVKNNKGPGLILTLARTDEYPRTVEQFEKLANAPHLFADRMALHTLATGYMRCEFIDEDGVWISTATLRIRDLAGQPTIDLIINVDPAHRPTRLVLTY